MVMAFCEGGGLLDKIGQDLGVLLAACREVGISADLAGYVVHGLAVLESRRSVWSNFARAEVADVLD